MPKVRCGRVTLRLLLAEYARNYNKCTDGVNCPALDKIIEIEREIWNLMMEGNKVED